MKISPKIHEALVKRVHAKNMVPIECDCGIHLAWPKSRGNTVVCPSCNRAETMPITDVPTAAVEGDAMNVQLAELPVPPSPSDVEKPCDVE